MSLGKDDAVAVVDVAGRKALDRIKVGKTPHGVKASPDGKFLSVTNTETIRCHSSIFRMSLQP